MKAEALGTNSGMFLYKTIGFDSIFVINAYARQFTIFFFFKF